MTIELSEEDSELLTEALSCAAAAVYGSDNALFLNIIRLQNTIHEGRTALPERK